jgi:hypothetical protein
MIQASSMTQASQSVPRIVVRSSRLWALIHLNCTRLLFPATMTADAIGVSTTNVDFWLTPWRRVDEHLPLSHIAEVTHVRGFFWDAISVESSGGLNPLRVFGVPKPDARYFVDHVRARLNEIRPVAPAQQ